MIRRPKAAFFTALIVPGICVPAGNWRYSQAEKNHADRGQLLALRITSFANLGAFLSSVRSAGSDAVLRSKIRQRTCRERSFPGRSQGAIQVECGGGQLCAGRFTHFV